MTDCFEEELIYLLRDVPKFRPRTAIISAICFFDARKYARSSGASKEERKRVERTTAIDKKNWEDKRTATMGAKELLL